MAIDIRKLEESPRLLDILIEMEDVIDSLDLYAFQGWISGVLLEGPIVTRYFAKIKLKYTSLPDPLGAMRLLRKGIDISYTEEDIEIPKTIFNKDELEDDEYEHQDEEESAPVSTKKIWIVEITIPRKLLNAVGLTEHDTDYEDEVDIDDVDDAIDGGLDENI